MDRKAAIYARTSTTGQQERHTIESQLIDCRDYCEAKGYPVIAEFADEAISGAVPFEDRPEGWRLLEAARDKLFDRVIILCADRLGRDVTEALLAMKTFKRLGLVVDFVIQAFDDSPAGRLQFQVLLAVAEFEKAEIRRRTMTGRAARVKSGKYQAPITPYGYTYNQETGELRVQPEQAEIVRQIFRWCTEGLGLKAIATRLKEQNISPPGQGKWGWQHTTVYKLLRSARYTGQTTYGGYTPELGPRRRGPRDKDLARERRTKDPEQAVPMVCPAIIDEATFNAAQEALGRRRQQGSGNVKHIYLLRGLLYCRECGSRYVALMGQQRGQPATMYVCRRRRVHGPEAGHENVRWRFPGKDLENAVKHHLLRLMADRDYLLADAQVYVEEAEQTLRTRHAVEGTLRTRLAGLEHEELRILDLAQQGVYRDAAQTRQQLDKVRTQQTEVRTNLEHVTVTQQVELTRAERVRLLAGIVTRRAYVGNRGLIRQVREDDAWIDETLVDLAKRTHLKVDASDGTEEPVFTTVAIEDWWADVVQAFVERIWVERDGRHITVEGTLGSASSKGSLVPEFQQSR